MQNRVWPRTSAYGARLWNYDTMMSNTTLSLAVATHAERLVTRGISADTAAMFYCRLFPEMCYNKQ